MVSCIRLIQGRLHEHEPARSAMAQDVVTKLPPTFFVARAHAARERDDREAARDAFERALALGLLEFPRGPTWATTVTWAADICAWLDDRSSAKRLLEQLTPLAGVMTWAYGPFGRGVGLLELALGHRSQAERRLRDAIALCERMDARAFLAMARLDLGALLYPSTEGRRLLDQALGTADELGMLGLAKRSPLVEWR
jgi:hypothetical protein